MALSLHTAGLMSAVAFHLSYTHLGRLVGFNRGMILHEELLIDGTFFGGPCDSSLAKHLVTSPFDGARVGVTPEAGWGEADAAIAAATRAFLPWSRTARPERQRVLRGCAQALAGNKKDLCELMALEIGKPIDIAEAEVDRAIMTFELAGKCLDDDEWESIDISYDPRAQGAIAKARREAIGPVLCITPYNWPINLAAHKIAPALAAGNTIVLKGSLSASLCSLRLARILLEADIPPGVLNAIHCESEIAERMATDPRIKMVSFTGSEGVGWHLKEKCWDKRVTLELGGTASVYVHHDAHMAGLAPSLATSAFAYAGQVCISTQNVYAHADIYDELRAALIDATNGVAVGDPRKSGVICGPVINAEAAQRIQSWIPDSSGQVLAGGSSDGQIIQPTLVEAPLPNSQLATQEVFGPVLNLQRVDVASLAMVEMARSPYGIHHSIFTSDDKVFEQFLKFVPSGGTIVNDVPSLRFDAVPYGGIKRSGFGREGPRYAIEEMTELRSLIRRVQPRE